MRADTAATGRADARPFAELGERNILEHGTDGGELYPDTFQRIQVTKTVFLRNRGST